MSLTSSDAGARAEPRELQKLRPFTALLRDGRPVRIRPIVPGDRRHLLAGLQRMSPRSVYFRFHSPVKTLSEAELAYLTELDQRDHVAWGAEALDESGVPGIAVARYVRDSEDPTGAEAAIAVTDDYQGVGLGTMLMETLIATALENGIEQLWGSILPDNEGAQRLFRRLGGTMEFQDGTVVGKIPVGWGYRMWRSSFPAAVGI
jgi:ribosomal protein S18 acetylase RimI-like enzyme